MCSIRYMDCFWLFPLEKEHTFTDLKTIHKKQNLNNHALCDNEKNNIFADCPDVTLFNKNILFLLSGYLWLFVKQ